MNLLDENLLKNSKTILSSCIRKIPGILVGTERQRFIGNEIVGKLPEEHRLILINLMNSFLMRMRELDASDIDLGGWAARGQVWLRINGVKKPVPELGVFSCVETDVLIQTILMNGQRDALFDQRNLDFSYIFHLNEKIARHRADAYFDMDDLALNMRAISTDIRSYENYEFHSAVTRVFNLAQTKEGLILITGITGSGKSSTLD